MPRASNTSGSQDDILSVMAGFRKRLGAVLAENENSSGLARFETSLLLDSYRCEPDILNRILWISDDCQLLYQRRMSISVCPRVQGRKASISIFQCPPSPQKRCNILVLMMDLNIQRTLPRDPVPDKGASIMLTTAPTGILDEGRRDNLGAKSCFTNSECMPSSTTT